MSQITITRAECEFLPDVRRVITKPFLPGKEGFSEAEDRRGDVLGRVLSIPEEEAAGQLADIVKRFAHRHQDFEAILEKNAARAEESIKGMSLSRTHRLLVGAYFTHEFSIEAAALTNPSVVLAPDQSGLATGAQRFLISLRAIGEGHISSVEFRSVVVDADLQVFVEPVSGYVGAGECTSQQGSNYQVSFPENSTISERVLFPNSAAESKGIEDARFVRFEEQGRATYYATYTAYDGSTILPQLIETEDFLTFRVSGLQGRFAQNKGMALFPRKIAGNYVALSRFDGESNSLLRSPDLHTWDSAQRVQVPTEPWELIKIGNNGSPIETSDGWLVLTHGVGPMRRYVLSAILLELEDPTKVIGRLRAPLLEPDEEEREGYVPNVLYTCGSAVHNGILLLPYGFSDMGCRIALVPLTELLAAMKSAT